MLKGGPAVAHLARYLPRITCLCLLAQLCVGARVPAAQREESELVNPLGAGEEERRLLQSYIQANLKEGEGSDVSTWEQAVFFLFHLYDFDRSGHMDGLEMMKLLSDYNSHKPLGTTTNDPIVSMVDFLLKTRDVNQDGLLGPSELLSSPLPSAQDPEDEPPQQQQEMAAEVRLAAPEDSLKPGGGGGLTEEEKHPGEHEDLIQQEEEVVIEKAALDQVLDDNEKEHKDLDGLQVPEAPAPVKEERQQHGLSVHQGQPEM